MDDLDRRLADLTSTATRSVVVPPPEEVRRRARQARRNRALGVAAVSFAVAAIAVSGTLLGTRATDQSPVAATPTVASPAPTRKLPPRPALTASPQVTPPRSKPATAPLLSEVPESAMLTKADVGSGWDAGPHKTKRMPPLLDPCGAGKLADHPVAQRSLAFTSEGGAVDQQVMSFSEEVAKKFMAATRVALERCRTATPDGGPSKVTYVSRGSLGFGDESVVVRVVGNPDDPVTTYNTVVRVGGLVMSLGDVRLGDPYTEKQHRALARKAVNLLPRP